jgi:hypothetical protein
LRRPKFLPRPFPALSAAGSDGQSGRQDSLAPVHDDFSSNRHLARYSWFVTCSNAKPVLTFAGPACAASSDERKGSSGKPFGLRALTPAEKQKAYRDRGRAIRDAPKLEAARRAAEANRLKTEGASPPRCRRGQTPGRACCARSRYRRRFVAPFRPALALWRAHPPAQLFLRGNVATCHDGGRTSRCFASCLCQPRSGFFNPDLFGDYKDGSAAPAT